MSIQSHSPMLNVGSVGTFINTTMIGHYCDTNILYEPDV